MHEYLHCLLRQKFFHLVRIVKSDQEHVLVVKLAVPALSDFLCFICSSVHKLDIAINRLEVRLSFNRNIFKSNNGKPQWIKFLPQVVGQHRQV